MHRLHRAFSFIEILVVLSIVAILALIIATAANSVRATSRSATCVVNLGQIGMAIGAYAVDYRGKLLPARAPAPGVNQAVYWYVLLTPYTLGDKQYSGWAGNDEIRGSKRDKILNGCPDYLALCKGVAVATYQDCVGYGLNSEPGRPTYSVFSEYGSTAWDPEFVSYDYAEVMAMRAAGKTGARVYREFALGRLGEREQRILCGDSRGGWPVSLAWGTAYALSQRDGPFYNRTGTQGEGYQRHRNTGNWLFADLHGGRLSLANARIAYTNPAALGP